MDTILKSLVYLFIVGLVCYIISPYIFIGYLIFLAIIFISTIAYEKRKSSYNNLNVNQKSIYTKIVGVTYNDRQKAISKLQIGDELYLIRQPNNPYDNNAILCVHNGYELGYISKSLAVDLAPQIDNGKHVFAIVKDVTGGDGLSYGCNIQIFIQ